MKAQSSKMIKAEATRLGFSFCGITKAEFLKEEKEKFDNYLKNGFNGDMMYMQNSDKRLNPALHVENAKSVILVLQNYFTEEKNDFHNPLSSLKTQFSDVFTPALKPARPAGRGETSENSPPFRVRGKANFQLSEVPSYKISKYASGKDYHDVVKNKLDKLLDFINKNICKTNSRAFVDFAPVLEKALAEKAGLGWRGKNTILINKTFGSFHFIGEIITDLEFDYDIPAENLCGSCNKCIEACPTKALVKPHVLDARKCISYLTIELKKNIPEEFRGKLNNWIFGCDICQDVCPWNKFSKPTEDKSLNTIPEIKKFTKKDWQTLTKEDFKKIFKDSAIKRVEYEKFVENINKS